MPTTSQVSVTDFQHLFGELLNQDLQILTILISSKLSGTVASALQAQADFPGAPIEVIDSQSIAMAMGFQVLAAARAAAAGANLADCKAIAEQARQHSGIVFAVDTLEFLHRGGRIGGATRWLGSALNLKPVLEITGGRVETVDKVRTRRKSLERVIEVVSERIQDKRPLRLAVGHADALAEAQDVLEAVKTRLAPIESYVTEFSPVAGAHGGPRSLALAYLAGM